MLVRPEVAQLCTENRDCPEFASANSGISVKCYWANTSGHRQGQFLLSL